MREFDEKSITQAVFERHPPGVDPNGDRIDTPYYTVEYDFRLRPAAAG
jgi:hydroxyquinol 1,2-dioxygenase